MMSPRLVFVAPAIALLALAAPAHASELRFSVTAKGGVVTTGNTLGLAKQDGANGPGTRDSIGAFLSPDEMLVDELPANPDNPWFSGTTSSWELDGSSAVLELPETSLGVEILYAELVWGGSYAYGDEDVSAHLDVPVTLSSAGMSYEAVPSPQTAVTLAGESGEGFDINYYMRSAEVTEFVAAQLSGTYTLTGVPATQELSVETLNAAGWSLVVVYATSEAATRNLSVFVGGQFVDEDATEDYLVSGFCTPPEGPVEGAVAISALEGDAHRTGDTLTIAPSADGPFAALAGPNNPVDNFFASQINAADGELDMLGTAGDLNHDALAGENVVGGRQGWDVTTVQLSSADGQLDNAQTSAVLRAVTSEDSFMPVLATFEIDVSSPDFEGSTAVELSPEAVAIAEQSTISFELLNEGEVAATGLSFTAPLGAGLELVAFAIDGVFGDANQQPVEGADLEAGVELGEVEAGEGLEVTLVVEAVGQPQGPDGWFVPATWTYDYVTCIGDEPLSAQSFAFADLGFVGGDEDGGEDEEGEDEAGGEGEESGEGGEGGEGEESGEGEEGEEGGEGEQGDGDGDGDPAGGTAGTGTDESGGEDEGDTEAGGGTETGTDTHFDPGLEGEGGCNCRSSGSGSGSGSPVAGCVLLGLFALLRRRRSA